MTSSIRYMRLLTAGALLVATAASALDVPRLHTDCTHACRVAAALDSADVPFDTLAYSLWAEPQYIPQVRFRIAHTGTAILLNFIVKETGTVAHVDNDNGPVFRDACVEFFVSPSADSNYYNFEMNCIGTLLMQGGVSGTRRALATPEILASVDRYTTFGNRPFESRTDTVEWMASMIIPKEAFFLDSIPSFDGMTMTANFYKCGGTDRNYITWRAIDTARPQFHRPECFDTLKFESSYN